MVVTLLILTLVLYLSVRLICGRKKLDGGYFLRLFFVSLILVVAVEAVAAALAALASIVTISSMFYVFLTVGFILLIRYLIKVPSVLTQSATGDKKWQWSIWITLISLFLILAIAFAVYYISNALGNPIIIFVPI